MNVEKYVTDVCKPGTEKCCAYLMMSPEGWECAKMSDARHTIELCLAKGTMRATGDNCHGRELIEK